VLLFVVLVAQTACLTTRVPRVDVVSFAQARAAWERVLEKYVDSNGRVAFGALAEDRADLDRFVRYVAEVDPADDPQSFPTAEAQLAHRINAYNALSMYGVLQLGIPRTNAGWRKVRFFFVKRYRVEGRTESLFVFEKRIRDLGDPRVHFALNCMSVSCPRLPREPFSGDRLEQQLESQAREFFETPSNLKLAPARSEVRVSSILKFYQGEFEARAGSLIGFINRYRDEPIPEEYQVSFEPYDWTINRSDLPLAGG